MAELGNGLQTAPGARQRAPGGFWHLGLPGRGGIAILAGVSAGMHSHLPALRAFKPLLGRLT